MLNVCVCVVLVISEVEIWIIEIFGMFMFIEIKMYKEERFWRGNITLYTDFAPEGFVPGRFVPGGFVPGGFVAEGFVPGGFVPGGFVPGGFVPGGFVPGGLSPGIFTPEASLHEDSRFEMVSISSFLHKVGKNLE